MPAPGSAGGGTVAETAPSPTVEEPFDRPIDLDHQLLIDLLVPDAPSRARRLLTAAAVIVAGGAIGLA